ncbi:MAG: response regulator transcription factor [Mycobacteriales bacterium]
MAVRVIVAEDSLIVREGVRLLLGREAGIDVIGVCGDLPELVALVDADPPDVVVTDVRMPPSFGDEGIRAATAFRTTHPTVGVVVLSQYAEPAYANELLEGGSAGRAYLLKERVSEPGQLTQAVYAVASGGSVIDPAVVDVIVAASVRAKPSRLNALSGREREVLDQIAQGKSNAAIANSLFLTERAIEKHINALFGKLGLGVEPDVNRRVKAVLMHLSDRRESAGG